MSRGRFLEGESFIRKGEAGGWRKEFSPEMDRSVLEDDRHVDTPCGQADHGVDTGQDWGAADPLQMELRDGDTINNLTYRLIFRYYQSFILS